MNVPTLQDELNVTLKTGQMKLFSYYVPSLVAGDYTVNIEHSFAQSSRSKLDLTSSEKKFSVVAPQFSLPPSDIHSRYPENGHAELAHVLPHVVLNDPHLPWERPMHGQSIGVGEGGLPATRMPWLGLLAFDTSELVTVNPLSELAKGASDSGSFQTSLQELWSLRSQLALPFDESVVAKSLKDPEHEGNSVSVIFVTGKTFNKLFCQQTGDRSGERSRFSLERFRYQAHVRIVHTQGMARAGGGVANEGDNESFSIIVSPRSGPSDLLPKDPTGTLAPIPMAAHLISLEGIESYLASSFPLPEGQLVCLVTLQSWSYQSLPVGHLNYAHYATELSRRIRPLQLSNDVIDSIVGKENTAGLDDSSDSLSTKEAQWLRTRLEQGYSFIRYRTSFGDSATALYHGPLSPVLNDPGESFEQSNDGNSLQIIDYATGFSDMTYHLAWEAGRSMAAADRVFSAAIMRLRARIHSTARKAYLLEKSPAAKPFAETSKGESDRLWASLSVKPIVVRSGAPAHHESMDMRWRKRAESPADPEVEETQATDQAMAREIQSAAKAITAMAVDDDQENDDDENKTSSANNIGSQAQGNSDSLPNSSNWSIVSQWCLDKLMLLDLPTVYMFPEPDVLPEESLCTFYVDEYWMNAYLDGVLSVANHQAYGQPDLVRQELKRNFNDSILQQDSQQIPSWGFLMRSRIVQAFPDLRIEAPWPENLKSRLEVVRMAHLAPDTLLCLFDRTPDEGLFPNGIEVSQPPHQQHFSVGDALTDEDLEMAYRILPTTGLTQPLRDANNGPKKASSRWERNGPPSTAIYDWDSRCVMFPRFAEECSRHNKSTIKEANSALVGIQLNDLPLTIIIKPQASQSKSQKPTKRLLLLDSNDQEIKGTQNSQAFRAQRIAGKSVQMDPPGPSPIRPLFSFPKPPRTLASATLAPLRQARLTTPGPGSKSYLEKRVYPLAHFGRNIPASRHGSSNLVFSISAVAGCPENVVLRSVKVVIPAGRDMADLLQVTKTDGNKLAVLPHVRTTGKGQRWSAVARENRLYRDRFKTRSSHGGRRKPPSTCLVVSLTPKGTTSGSLLLQPDLSFLIEGVQINALPCKEVHIVIIEDYKSATEDGKSGPATEPLLSEVVVEKERLAYE